MKKQFHNKTKQAGVTLIEALSVILIGILLLVGGLALYGNTQSKQRESELISSIMTIQTNVRDLFYGENNYGTNEDITETLIDAGGVPGSMIDSAGTGLSSPYDSSKEVVITGNASKFTISIEGIPKASCIALATKTGSFDGVFVGAAPSPTATTFVDYTPATAAAACGDSDNIVTYQSS